MSDRGDIRLSRARERLQIWLLGIYVLALIVGAVISLTSGGDPTAVDTYSTDGGPLHFIAAHIVNFMNASPSFAASLVALLVVTGPATLVHELGHAIVARRRLSTTVDIHVGTTGRLPTVHLGPIAAHIAVLGLPGRIAGSATFNAANMTAKDALAIALAGPAASLLWLVVCARAWDLHRGGILGDLLWAATFAGVFGCLLNLVPMTLLESDGRTAIRSDGCLALDAWRALRGRPLRG
jgi:hypothetical protein